MPEHDPAPSISAASVPFSWITGKLEQFKERELPRRSSGRFDTQYFIVPEFASLLIGPRDI
jgi:hypothetical protein